MLTLARLLMMCGAALNRRDDWQPRLTQYIATNGLQPFEFGVNDCALFAAGAVEAMTGEDIAAPFRGYTNERGGLLALKRAGFEDHVDLCRQSLPTLPGHIPQTGDIALVPGDGGNALGVVVENIVIVLGPDRMDRMPMSDIIEVFAV